MEYINKQQAVDLIESMIADKGVAFNPHKLAMAVKDLEGMEIVHCKDCKWAEKAILDEYCVECTMYQTSCMRHGYCHHGEHKEKVQLSQETPTTSKTETVDTDLISRQAAIQAMAPFDTNHELRDTLEGLPSERPKGEWASCSEPPKDRRNVFLAHGTNDFKSCCIGHYEQGMGWYEDRNFFAKPIYDCKYWCDIPELPDLGNNQFGTEVSADMRGDK